MVSVSKGVISPKHFHTFQGERMQVAMFYRYRVRMYDSTVLIERNHRRQVLVFTPIIQQDDRGRVLVMEIAYQVDDTVQAFMHQAGEYIGEGPLRGGSCGRGDDWFYGCPCGRAGVSPLL